MTPQVYEALSQVAQSMEGFNRAVELWIEGIKKTEKEPAKVERLSRAAKAMKDSSHIYLAWAEHLANGLPGEQETGPSDSSGSER